MKTPEQVEVAAIENADKWVHTPVGNVGTARLISRIGYIAGYEQAVEDMREEIAPLQIDIKEEEHIKIANISKAIASTKRLYVSFITTSDIPEDEWLWLGQVAKGCFFINNDATWVGCSPSIYLYDSNTVKAILQKFATPEDGRCRISLKFTDENDRVLFICLADAMLAWDISMEEQIGVAFEATIVSLNKDE